MVSYETYFVDHKNASLPKLTQYATLLLTLMIGDRYNTVPDCCTMSSTVQESISCRPSSHDKKIKSRSGKPTVAVYGFTKDDIGVTKAGYETLLRVKLQ